MRSYEQEPDHALDNTVEFGEYIFDFSNNFLFFQGQKIELQHKPSEVLALLLHSNGRLVTRDDIVQQVWGSQIVDFDQNINFSIKCIRKALNDNPRDPHFVQTIPRKGYQFIAQVITPKARSRPRLLGGFKAFHLKSLTLVAVIMLAGLAFYYLKTEHTETHDDEIILAASQDLKRAQYLLDKGDSQSLKTSIEIFKRLSTVMKNSADVDGGLAVAILLSAENKAHEDMALEYAERAYNKNTENAFSNLAMGMVAFYLEWDMPKAEFYLKKATELDPRSVRAWHELSVIETIMGKYEAGKNSIEQALSIDPGRVQEVFHAGWFYLAFNNPEEALEQCRKSIEIKPSHLYSHLCIIEAALNLGLNKTAQNHMLTYMKLLKVPDITLNKISSSSGNDTARMFFNWQLEYAHKYGADDFYLALAYAQVGDQKQVLKFLDEAIEQRLMMIPTAWAFSQFDGLRENQEFMRLMSVVKRE